MNSYICVGAIMKDRNNRDVHVVSVDRKNKLAVVYAHGKYSTERFQDLRLVSYKGVH